VAEATKQATAEFEAKKEQQQQNRIKKKILHQAFTE